MTTKVLPRYLPFLALGLGLCVIAFSAILARYGQAYGMPSLAIASIRLLLSGAIIAPVAWYYAKNELLSLSLRQLKLALIAGACLALHFAAWISSLEYTSVASSTALVTTNVLWIGIISFLFFKEPIKRLMILGMIVSLSGSLLIFWSDHRESQAGVFPLLGNFLALIGSWLFSAYLLIGKRLRKEISLSAHIGLAYGISAIVMLIVCLFSNTALTGYSSAAYLVALGMALGPQLIGHTAFNWSLKHVSPSFVAIVTLGEPVCCAALAWVFFGETFASLQAVGFVLLLSGIYLASRAEFS